MILIYAGRRQLADAEGVRKRVAELLESFRPRLLVGSAAAGADLLVLGLARAKGIAAHLVLLGGVAEFEEASVSDLGGEWAQRYREILADTGVSVEVVEAQGPDRRAAHLMVNSAIVEAARRTAAEDEEIVALAVLEESGNSGSVTADLISRAERYGWPTVRTPPTVEL
ncbi:hypothetical protein [Streptomyces sp. NPDC058964]|uniref:hypothetical protein n=1 Tax=Streptomyces sp. NPDC058964 TaxID=3346681 RepID=UPI00369376C3